jgi:hypothetical protein
MKQEMKANDVRNWLGIYFLSTTACFGAYILLFAETHLLPINKEDCDAAFQIMIPFFVGQLTIVFKWIAGDQRLNSGQTIKIPTWAVKGPPIAVAFIFAMAILSLVVTGRSETGTWLDGPRFKAIVTFGVAILNASTVFIVMKLFGTPAEPNEQLNAGERMAKKVKAKGD